MIEEDMILEISIHALLTESDLTLIQKLAHLCLISIHALLTESDMERLKERLKLHCISIHALLTESDLRPKYFLT